MSIWKIHEVTLSKPTLVGCIVHVRVYVCLLTCLLELTTLLQSKFQMSTFKHFAKTDCPRPVEIGHDVTLNVQVHAICENLDPKNLRLCSI